MRAVRLHDVGDIRFEQVELAPTPPPGQLRVQVAFAGICGSDIHNYKTGQWISRRPSTAGHEFSGVVIACGKSVTNFAVGDKVVADSRDYCGRCANCGSARHHLCTNLGFVGESIDGGFADFVDLPVHLALRCHDTTPLDIAALAEPLAVALHALALIDADQGPLLIIGCGPIGTLSAVASALSSDRQVYVCDRVTERTKTIAELTGATPVVLADVEKLTNKIRNSVHQVLDTTGQVGVIETVMKHLSGGTLGLVGIGSGALTLDPVHLVEREISIVGCHAFTDELPQAIDILQQYPDMFADLIRHRIPLEDVPREFEKIAGGAATGIKTLIEVAAP